MPTRHRNSKSHKKSLRNRVQKGGAKLEKGSVKLTNIKNINDLDGATYTQDLMNIHSYKIHVSKTIEAFKQIANKFTEPIAEPIYKYIDNTSDIVLLWDFPKNDSPQKKIMNDVTLKLDFYAKPVTITLPEHDNIHIAFVLFTNDKIFIITSNNDATKLSMEKIYGTSKPIPQKIIDYYNKQLNPLSTRLSSVKEKVMSADLTGACNRCTYTFSEEEQQQVLALLGGQSGTTFNANLSFDNGKLTLVTNDTPQE
jgi:hypothetical protein